MDAKGKKASAAAATATKKKQVVIKEEDSEEMIVTAQSKQTQEFVDNMKKRATVKTYGIDNVRIE